MDFRILGALEVRDERGPVRLGGPKQRALLVLLLLHRGEAVSTDRLVDALWGDVAPPAAVKTVQTYISQLRRALGDGLLATRGRAYVLELEPGALDAERFEALVAEARQRLEAGDQRRGADLLRRALTLWRGPALADVAYEAFAQRETARLEELRLGALEDRIEADLALGRHVNVLAEVEALVSDHPLRERLRGQLMRALYRSGRQAEALAAYREGRRVLVEELGLEPSPELRALERAILQQDQSLAPPGRTGRTLKVLPRKRPRRYLRPAVLLAVGGGLALMAAIAAALIVTSRVGDTAGLASVAPDSVGVIDPRSNTVVEQLAVGAGPVAVGVGEDAVWIANGGEQTVSRIDPRTRRVEGTIGLGRIPTDLTVGSGAVWLASATAGFGGGGTVSRLEPRTDSLTTVTVRRDDEGDPFSPATPNAIAIGAGAVWTNHLREQLARLRPGGAGRVQKFSLGAAHSADGIVVYDGSLWVTSSVDDKLLRIAPESGRVVARISIAATPDQRVAGPYGVVAGYGSLWVSDPLANAVSRVDPRLNAVSATIPVGRRPTRLAAGAGAVWALNAADGTVSRIEPRTSAVSATIHVAHGASDIAAGAAAVWVTVAGGQAAPKPRTGSLAVEPLPRSSCSPVLYAGSGRPDVLIASDLPRLLNGEVNDEIVQMRRAIRSVLEQRRFRAGRYRVGYQACDSSSISEGDDDPARCAANARAYARDRSLIGVIGTYHSFCAAIELPILNTAPGGPLAMISPSNTYVGLTHSGPGTAADEPDRYYPSGKRNYARLPVSDEHQAAALVELAGQLGASRLFLLHDDQGTGFAHAKYVDSAARKRGLRIAGVAGWDPTAHGYAALAAKVRASRADGLLVAGCMCENVPALLRDLRTAVGDDISILAPDMIQDATRPLGSVRAAHGLYVSIAGLPPERLEPQGRRLQRPRRTARRAARRPNFFYVAYAAEAAQVLLDGVARSDGTRPSVTNAMLASRSDHGSVRFNANGDPESGPVAIYRVTRTVETPTHSTATDEQGLELDRLITPRRTLVPYP